MPGSANDLSSASINPEEMATQSVRIKEEQLRKEEEKLREIELKVQREISEKRQELLAREESLKGESAVRCGLGSKLTQILGFQSWSNVFRHSRCRIIKLEMPSITESWIPSRQDVRNQCPC